MRSSSRPFAASALLLVGVSLTGCGQAHTIPLEWRAAPSAGTGALTTAAQSATPTTPAPSATAIGAYAARNGDCVEHDARGSTIYPKNGNGPAARRALAEQVRLDRVTGLGSTASALCTDGRRILVASPTFTTRRVRPNGDIELPIPKSFDVMGRPVVDLCRRYGAAGGGYDVIADAYVLEKATLPLPKDTTYQGIPVHFEYRPGSASVG